MRAIILATLAATLALFPATAGAAFPGGNGVIAFSRDVGLPDGNVGYDVYTIRPDGTAMRNLTQRHGDDRWPSFSPDGRRIVFTHDDSGTGGGPNPEIWVMDADGRNPGALGPGFAPSWSPDGSQIALARGECAREAPCSIWVMNADGSGARQIASLPVTVWLPVTGIRWSPDDSKIAVRDELGRVQSMRLDGTGARTLVDASVVSGGTAPWCIRCGFDFFPDGETFLLDVPNPNLGFGPILQAGDWTRAIRVASAGARRAERPLLDHEWVSYFAPAVSPDGARLVYFQNVLEQGNPVYNQPTLEYTMRVRDLGSGRERELMHDLDPRFSAQDDRGSGFRPANWPDWQPIPQALPSTAAVSVGDLTVSETEDRGGFCIRLSAPVVKPVEIGFSIFAGFAQPEGDFVPKRGEVTLAPGKTVRCVGVTLQADDADEPGETVLMRIANVRPAGQARRWARGARKVLVVDGLGILSIEDDDASPPPPAGGAEAA